MNQIEKRKTKIKSYHKFVGKYFGMRLITPRTSEGTKIMDAYTRWRARHLTGRKSALYFKRPLATLASL